MAETVSIRKASPSVYDEMKNMQDLITRRAYEIFQGNGGYPGRDLDNWLQAEGELMWVPPIELREKDGHLTLEAALSGVEPKDLDIEVTPDDIIIKADIHHAHKEQNGTVHICEFETGKLYRSIRVPKKINPDKVKAELRNGVLKLTAEVTEEAHSKKIKPEAA